jgi:pimeloyl-ACP methyl ester carboxylesterase
MTDFLLIHGAWHGSWCWRAVIAQLERKGHRAYAPDLPCDDANASWDDYAAAALDELEYGNRELQLVGHSLGGGVIPLIAANELPITRLVFVCSYPPAVGKSLDEAIADAPDLSDPQALAFRDSRDASGNYVWPSFESAQYAMYHDCETADARDAFARLRSQSSRPFSDPWPLHEWPDIPVSFIVCAGDRMGKADVLARTARERFGVTARVLKGSHSPFLSRPRELVEALTS